MAKKVIELYLTKISYFFLLLMILFDILIGILCVSLLYQDTSNELSFDLILLLVFVILTVIIFLINRKLEKRVKYYLFNYNKEININKVNSTEKTEEEARKNKDLALMERNRAGSNFYVR